MKIMYLLFSFTVGGTEKLVSDMCNEMATRGNDVFLYIVNDYYSDQFLKTLNNNIHLELQNRKAGSGEKIHTIFHIAKYIKRNGIEVVHCNSLYSPELLILKPYYFSHTKVVHTIHDVGQYGTLPKWKIILRNYLCDSFIAISTCVKNDVINAGANPRKVRVLYNAINIEKYKMHSKKKFNNKHVIIGNVARIMPEKKGQDILIDALAILKNKYPEILCKFAGGYDLQHEEAYKKLEQQVKDLHLCDNVEFLGNISDVPGFLKTLDLFVLPSRFEGFGISLIEAMAMGIPCIASNLDGPAEIIGNNERGFLFEVGNAQALAKKMDYMIDNYQEITRNQKRNIDFVYSNFSITQMCERLMSIYIGE